MGDSIKFEAVKKTADVNFKINNFENISKINSISPPSVFIGSKLKYPLVNVGILSPVEKDEDAWIYDNAKYWAENNFSIEDVLKLRNGLLNSRFQTKVSDARMNKKFVDISKSIAISSRQVDVEIELQNKIMFGRDKDRVLTPHGMKGSLKKAEITGNVKIDKKLDKVMNDEFKTSEGIELLYKNDFNEYSLSQILSVGVMGLKKDRRLVPTRWSITATDDMIARSLWRKVKDNKWIEDYELFYGEFMGNQYLIMLMPGIWNYELFEFYLPGSSWNPSSEIKAATDFEGYSGRKSYAFNTVGGYYAVRLPILEYLNSIQRQAKVLVFRIETPSYWAALGVWVCRESVRKALQKKMRFDSQEELINSLKQIGKIKYNFDFLDALNQSKILREDKTQKSLGEWF
jgi:hypothetical protein